jgi:Mn2+/Fe2+ NRAMP family transporter
MTTVEEAFAHIESAVDREERLRATDRYTVAVARATRRPLHVLALLSGPGVLVMLGENDGPSMVSYAATGASYGIGFFVPFIVVTFIMAFVIQEMTVRLGAATRRGHSELIFERFGSAWGYFSMCDLLVGNFLTLVAEFVAVQAGALYFGISPLFSVPAALLLLGTALAVRRYATWERTLLALSVGNLLFIPAALLAHPNGAALLGAFAHWGPIPGGITVAFVTLILSNIGATVTPWMVFFQQSAVVDKGLAKEDIAHGRIDTAIGSAVAAVVAIATVSVASTLFAAHANVSNLVSGADFASALLPHIGSTAATLFALGIIEAGLVAAMTISTSSAYAFSEVFKSRHSLNADFSSAKWFYATAMLSAIAAGAIVLIPHAPLLTITIGANIVATVLMAPTLCFLLLLANDRTLMGDLANGWKANVAGVTIAGGIVIISAVYAVISVVPHLAGH